MNERARPVAVRYDTSRPSGTTAEAADFTAQTNRTVTIPAGTTTGTIAVPTANDTVDEDDETFRLTLSSPTNATLATADATATGTINDQPVLRRPVVLDVEVLPPRTPALDLARGYGYSPEQLSSNVLGLRRFNFMKMMAHGAGTELKFVVTFDRDVNVMETGKPTLDLDLWDDTMTATWDRASGISLRPTLTFT